MSRPTVPWLTVPAAPPSQQQSQTAATADTEIQLDGPPPTPEQLLEVDGGDGCTGTVPQRQDSPPSTGTRLSSLTAATAGTEF